MKNIAYGCELLVLKQRIRNISIEYVAHHFSKKLSLEKKKRTHAQTVTSRQTTVDEENENIDVALRYEVQVQEFFRRES